MASLVLLAACSSTGGTNGGGGGGAQGPTTIGEIKNFQPTKYEQGVDLADLQAGGIDGFGASKGTLVGTSVKKTDDDITITAGGETLTLNYAGQVPGQSYQIDGYTNTATGNEAFFLNGSYVGIAALTSATTDEIISLSVTGQETVNLPSQVANYGGVWMSSADPADVGYIDVTADFENTSLDFTLGAASGIGGKGKATIDGSQFAGNIDLFGGAGTGSGTLTGAFYGPNANEIGGVSNGTYAGQAYTGAFYGERY
ncbi:transferrin-binding protein-like solute binding protein [Devosia sp. YIM 151766]|uniref:transferrin-binding protein-like solute binding protein n=1 Tax=Devosia sp. YIM 151766 TaxID=3017325 RepID=UPI00255CDCE4|nr:transferrin-binding protein-like solute binding protein [Devosia sp. YIM 151766]WIY53959.1 transferrin-binding protein-like solute binding protein [Devosia sp. YIM 151766]